MEELAIVINTFGVGIRPNLRVSQRSSTEALTDDKSDCIGSDSHSKQKLTEYLVKTHQEVNCGIPRFSLLFCTILFYFFLISDIFPFLVLDPSMVFKKILFIYF